MELATKKYIESVDKVESEMLAAGALVGHECDASMLPLVHAFFDGMYVREIFLPAGTFLTSKIHKTEHPYFVMEGECSVLTEGGIQRIKAPFFGVTKRGTKRVIYVKEDTRWITVHATEETELDKIEEQLIAKTVNDLKLSQEDTIKLMEVQV